MTDKVIIPLAGIGTLVLDVEIYATGLAEGAKLSLPTVNAATLEPYVDSEGLSEMFRINARWFERAAIEGTIPSVMLGRWRRFKPSDVARALQASGQQH